MKNIVIKDVAPKKLLDLGVFMKEMNQFVVLVTNASGPAVSESNISKDERPGIAQFQLEENGYSVLLDAYVSADGPTRVDFRISEGKTCLFQSKYTIRDTPHYALQVILNCDSESIIKEELIRTFNRDFSEEAHIEMTKSINEIRAEKLLEKEKQVIIEEEDSHIFEENEKLIQEMSKEKGGVEENDSVTIEESSDPVILDDEVSIELDDLSQKILDSIKETKLIIETLSNISHDMTRGQSADFSQQPIIEQLLENGATVEMIDVESGDYTVTFRKGVIDDSSEISFFLEKGDELIFSVYLSSEGFGKVSAQGSNGEHVVNQVKGRLIS